jgi:hypothetical protein
MWGAWLGAGAGLLITIVLLILLTTISDGGFGIPGVITIGLIIIPIGWLIGWAIGTRSYSIIIPTIIGFLIGISYFLIKYIPYTQLPRIEQRGFSTETIISLLLTLGGTFIGFLIGWGIHSLIRKLK